MTTPPEISGYRFDEQLLDHPLAEVWRGKSTTGMDVLVLRLSEDGAADPEVRRRLERASRTEAPLWAGNLAATRPYAVTQLLPDQAGAERFLDPLDGIIGNDAEAVEQVRERLLATTPYAASPATGPYAASPATGPSPVQAVPGDDGNRQSGVPEEAGRFDRWVARQGWRAYAVITVAVLVAFTAFYSAGAVIRSAGDEPLQPTVPRPAAVSPSAMPTGVLLPGVPKAVGARYNPSLKPVRVVGAVYTAKDKPELVQYVGLPFVFRWPSTPESSDGQESADAIYRSIFSLTDPRSVVALIAVHPCRDLGSCLAERPAFDARWSKRWSVRKPQTASDGRTWFTEDRSGTKLPYVVTMSHAFESNGVWWLAGVLVGVDTAPESVAQKVLNDIRTQTP